MSVPVCSFYRRSVVKTMFWLYLVLIVGGTLVYAGVGLVVK